jgi:hypothetical protein
VGILELLIFTSAFIGLIVQYPAVENIPGEIIFYIGLHISHTRAED